MSHYIHIDDLVFIKINTGLRLINDYPNIRFFQTPSVITEIREKIYIQVVNEQPPVDTEVNVTDKIPSRENDATYVMFFVTDTTQAEIEFTYLKQFSKNIRRFRQIAFRQRGMGYRVFTLKFYVNFNLRF